MSAMPVVTPAARTALALVAVLTLVAALVAMPELIGRRSAEVGIAGGSSDPAWQRLDADEPAPGFSLTDQHGHRVSLGDLRGRVAIVTFLFTHCTDVCPVLPEILARVDGYLDAVERERLVYVGVSIDPARDSPQRLREFVETHRLDASRWILLTGSARELAAVADDYGVVARPDSRLGFVHNTVFVLIDPDGRLRTEFHGLATPSPEIARVVRETLSPSRRSSRPW
ncbi:MAG: SCO family protein [Burkholderiales bacterium]|nr:SCO family protein [Burkholderiales bacterium]